MKTDTLTGPNLSYWVAKLDGQNSPSIREHRKGTLACFIHMSYQADDPIFDYADPATFQPIAERELIGVERPQKGQNPPVWRAVTDNKAKEDYRRYRPVVSAEGSTMAEAMMRCYVKSYLGDETKGG